MKSGKLSSFAVMRGARLFCLVLFFTMGGVAASGQSNPNEEQGLKPYDSWHAAPIRKLRTNPIKILAIADFLSTNIQSR